MNVQGSRAFVNPPSRHSFGVSVKHEHGHGFRFGTTCSAPDSHGSLGPHQHAAFSKHWHGHSRLPHKDTSWAPPLHSPRAAANGDSLAEASCTISEALSPGVGASAQHGVPSAAGTSIGTGGSVVVPPASASPSGTAGGASAAPAAPGGASSSSSTTSSSAASTAPPSMPHISASESTFTLKPIHIALFTLVFIGGALFATCTLQFTTDMEFTVAVATVLRRVARSVAFRQLVVIAMAILAVRFGLNSVLQALTRWSASPVQWDKTKLYYILREVYQPLELLLCIAALCTIADSFVPSLISVPKTTVTHLVKSLLSMSFIISAGSVVHNLKGRFCKENAWQSEMKGDVTGQRRWEAYDKLATFSIYAVSFVLGIQAIGLEVTSVLAIGGVGGLAIGLAGREIAENLLNGFLIMSTNPFEVGDEVIFFHSNKQVEGFVIDIGWYRTLIRSFEREIYVIPNAVFSKNILLNVTRKNREFRFHEYVSVRVKDAGQVNAIVQDIRRIVRSDTRILSKLHRRIFLDKISADECKIYVSFYVEAQNRDQFMAMKQDMLLAFIDCVERNEAQLATPRRTMDLDPELVAAISSAVSTFERASAQRQGLSMLASVSGSMAGSRSLDGSGASYDESATSSLDDYATRGILTVDELVATTSKRNAAPPQQQQQQPRTDNAAGATGGGGGGKEPRTDVVWDETVDRVWTVAPSLPSERSASGLVSVRVAPSVSLVGSSTGTSGSGGSSVSVSAGSNAASGKPSGGNGSSGASTSSAEAAAQGGGSSSAAGTVQLRNNIVEAPSILRSTVNGAAAIAVERRRNWMETFLRNFADALFFE